MSAQCWQKRGCDAEMASVCPHATASYERRCVIGCYYTNCSYPQYRLATDQGLLLDPSVDRNAAIKESCAYCEFFLRHGPRLNSFLSQDA